MIPFPCQTNKPLSELSTLGIGGVARYLASAHSIEQMQEMIRFARNQGLPFLVLGKGSNCLFDDRGFGGLVVLNRIDFLDQEGGCFTAGSGFSFARLGQITAREGYTGLEFASGIPATVGGAVFMNAGATKQQTADRLVWVDYITERGELIRFQKEDLHFGYRTSSFQKWGGAIAVVQFELEPSEQARRDQKEHLSYRVETQPYGEKSAGCAFRNPLEGAAGKLIEECGLKGLCVGGAQVSLRHANFIVNTGGATSDDIKTLIATIKERIFAERGILLEEEIRTIPYV